MNFFTTVQYTNEHTAGLINKSVTGYAERIADLCRLPGNMAAAELWGGGKKYQITLINGRIACRVGSMIPKEGLTKALRIVLGVTVGAFGQLLALPLMALAFTNEEIRLKHRVINPSEEGGDRLRELIRARLDLAAQKAPLNAYHLNPSMQAYIQQRLTNVTFRPSLD